MISRRLLLAAAPGLALAAGTVRAAEIRGELKGGLLFLRARIGPGEGLFLLDTGAPVTVLDRGFAGRAKVREARDEVIVGVGGARIAARAEAAELTLEGGPAVRVEASITDLAAVAARIGLPLAGIVGSDFLSDYTATLDYGRGTLSLAIGPASSPSAAPMRFGRTPYVRATAVLGAKSASGEFQIDTGANTAVVLWKPFAERHFPGAGAASGAVQGVAGVSQARIGRLTALEVAGQRLAGLSANFADEVRPDDAGRDHAGVIGGPAFSGRRIIIDYPGQRFSFA